MANIMALVSKSGRKDIEREHGEVALGGVVAVSAYHSKHKVLEGLEAGGSLFMVTVDDGKLLVVAVLHNPSFDGKSWTAPPNEVPVLDISHLVPELEFSTGKGLKVPPEKWAMSLQTPRELSDGDVARLRARTAPSAGSAFQSVMANYEPPATPAKGRKRSRPAVSTTDAKLSWPEALATVESWSSLGDDARQAALAALAEALNEQRRELDQRFRPDESLHGVARLGALIHEPSNLSFVAVPGGSYWMGFTADDILSTLRVMSDEELDVEDLGAFTWSFTGSRPPRHVAVRPFLASTKLVGAPSLLDATGCDEVDDALAELGFRNPSEAEWEWIAREGGPVQFVGLPVDRHPLGPTLNPPVQYDANGWGFGDLHNVEQAMADGWHDNYVGAPATSAPWPGKGATARSAHTWWQGGEEAQALHAAARLRSGGEPRLVVDLPDADIPVAPDVAAPTTSDETLETLTARGTERKRALMAIAGTTLLAGPDTAGILDWLLAHRDKPTKGVWLDALSLLARVAGNDPSGMLADTIASHFDTLRELLKDKKPAVRAAAVALLSAARGDVADGAAEALKAELKLERRHAVRAGILLSLATLAPDHAATTLREYTKHKEPVVRAAAVIGLAWVIGPDELSESEQEEIALATGLSAEKADELPWAAGRLDGLAQDLLEKFTDGDRVRRKAALEMAKRAAEDHTAWQASNLALQMVFSSEHPPHSLDDTQREIVRMLTQSGGIHRWSYVHLPMHLLDRLALTGDLKPAGVLERVTQVQLGGTIVELPVINAHLALFHYAEAQKWSDDRMAAANRALFGELDPLERLEVWVQRSRGALSRQRKVDGKWRPFARLGLDMDDDAGDGIIAAAVAEDPVAVRALVERLVQLGIDLHPLAPHTTQYMGWEALAAVIEPGEVLPEDYWDIVPLEATRPRAVLEAIPEDVRRKRAAHAIDRAIEFATPNRLGHFCKNTINALAPILDLFADEDNVLSMLAMASVAGVCEERQQVVDAVAALEAEWVVPLLEDFRKNGDVDLREGQAERNAAWAYLERVRRQSTKAPT